MNASKLSDWLQIVGLFGVIGSLIFVGLQMQQDRQVAILAAYQARTDLTVETTMAMAANHEMMAAYTKLQQGAEFTSLTGDELLMIVPQAAAQMYMTENIHFQYISGFLPEEHWRKSRAVLKHSLVMGPMRLIYENNPDQWRDSFSDLLEEIIAEIDAEGLMQ
jgi:hypothetical protein